MDDAVNFLPSRLSALLLILAAFLCKENGQQAFKIWRRDRKNHASPNSAQTEAVVAGALGIQLAGPASYFGTLYDKPTIGDPIRPIEPQDILWANDMMVTASVLAVLLLAGMRGVMLWI